MKNLISSMLILMMIMAFQLTGACSSGGTKTDKEVQKAFDLRMKGQVDEAKTLLESILAKDSTIAMAHYELGRLKQYMFVGGGKASLDEVTDAANKAAACEPKNVVYSYFLAMAKFMNAFMAMQMQKEDVKSLVQEACVQFEKVLALKPDYHEAMLYLVEMYGMLPPDMGGDSLKAAFYAEKLVEADSYLEQWLKLPLRLKTLTSLNSGKTCLQKIRKIRSS